MCANCATKNSTIYKISAISSDGNVKNEVGGVEKIFGFGQPDMITLFVVRHAEKLIEEGNSNPDLSPTGTARAVHLGELLRPIKLSKTLTTNTLRTIATADPARNMQGGIPIETYAPDRQPMVLNEILRTEKGHFLLVVGHSNTVPELLNYLSGTKNYTEIPAQKFDDLYIVTVKNIGNAKIFHYKY